MVTAPPLALVCSRSPKWIPWKSFISPGKLCIRSNQTFLLIGRCPEISIAWGHWSPQMPISDEHRCTKRTPIIYYSTSVHLLFPTWCCLSAERKLSRKPQRKFSIQKTEDFYYKPAFQKSKHSAVIWALPLTASSILKSSHSRTACQGQQSVNWCINWSIFHETLFAVSRCLISFCR